MSDESQKTEETKKDAVKGPVRVSESRAGGRVLKGTVVSTKMQDTISVIVDRYVKHPKYKKFMRRSKKYLVDDKGNTAAVGDKVAIREVPPISKRKRFALVKSQKV